MDKGQVSLIHGIGALLALGVPAQPIQSDVYVRLLFTADAVDTHFSTISEVLHSHGK
jgi:hypothetical protein